MTINYSSIYVIQCNGSSGPVKIGQSKKPLKRIRGIQTNNPYPLELLKTVSIPFNKATEIESSIHAKFSEFNIMGEWFKADVLNFLDEYLLKEWNLNFKIYKRLQLYEERIA